MMKQCERAGCGADFDAKGKARYCPEHRYRNPAARYDGPVEIGAVRASQLRRGHLVRRGNGDFMVVHRAIREPRGMLLVGLDSTRVGPVPYDRHVKLYS